MALTLIDFGMVVLIWMTQLIVYPSFGYFEEKNLLAWHKKYTSLISIIVMPLMILQLGLHLLGIWEAFNLARLMALVVIVWCWTVTFVMAVPLHQKISSGAGIKESTYQLVRINWYRTAGWTVVFILSILGS